MDAFIKQRATPATSEAATTVDVDRIVGAEGSPMRVPGKCNMKGQCGKKSTFSPDLPCAVSNVDAEEPDQAFRDRLAAVCGTAFASGPVCCEAEQVRVLAASLDQAEPLISSCPACRNNFRDFFCSFTCSPNQSQFLDVSATQKTDGNHGPAVKSVDFWVSEQFRQGFYDSCKNVKFGASNGFAMDLLGGGAKDADTFLKYLGAEKPLVGSPFQINFPKPPPPSARQVDDNEVTALRSNSSYTPPIPYDPAPRGCGNPDLLSRCACTDCPSVCTELPYVPPPQHGATCYIGWLSCFSFSLILIYALGLLAFLGGFQFKAFTKRKNKKRIGIRHRSSGISISSEAGYEQVRLSTDGEGEVEPTPAADMRGRHNSTSSDARGDSTGTDDASSSVRNSIGTGDEQGLLHFAGEGSLNALRSTQPRSYAINSFLSQAMYKLGLVCARSPYVTFAVALFFIALANLGWRNFQVETDPVRLWVAPNSPSKLRKEFFDENFGPFYRTQQVFLTDASAEGYSRSAANASHVQASLAEVKPVLTWERLQWWAEVEKAIRDIKSEKNGIAFQDVCFAPTGKGGPCVVQSFMGYFQDDLEASGVNEQNWAQKLDACADSPAECLPTFSQPLKTNIVFGGIPADGKAHEARAAVFTFIVSNSVDKEVVDHAKEWEKALETLLLDISGDADRVDHHPLAVRREKLGLRVALSTEISLEEEIASSSNTDGSVVILSYVLMLLYAAGTLGGGGPKTPQAQKQARAAPPGQSVRTGFAANLRGFLHGRRRGPIRLEENEDDEEAGTYSAPTWRDRVFDRLFIRSKFSLGLFGIVIILLAISSAVGIFSALGVKVTLVIAEVIPFLVLAVGVDNVFLLSNEMDRQNSLASTNNPYFSGSLDRESASSARGALERANSYDEGDVDGVEAPTLGSNLPWPAFHLPATERAARALSRTGPSILLSATIQITAFLLGSLVPMPAVRNFALYAAGSMAIAATLHCTMFVAALALDADRIEAGRIDCLPCIRRRERPLPEMSALGISPGRAYISEGWLSRFIREKYAPNLIRKQAKRVVLAIFAGILVVSVIFARKVEMGLDQRLALPPQSYLRSYFDAVDTWLEVGPPVYFVADHVDVKQRPGQQHLCGRFTTCDAFSLANTLEGERKRPESSFIAEPASIWIDDFLGWLNPVLEGCCRVKVKDPSTFCKSSDSEFDCQPCFLDREPAWNITMNGLPEGSEFMLYLRQWLNSPTNEDCPLGGQAAYSAALSLKGNQQELEALSNFTPAPSAEDEITHVAASHARTFHTPLRSQAHFIDALHAAERISSDIKVRTGTEVFAYSVFYVFFDQYLHLTSLAARVLGGAAAAIFGITTILLGSWRTALVVTACVASALIGVVGAMGAWGIGFNALTLVNLTVCAAICVEFCAHIARAFMRAPGGLPRSHPLSQKERDDRAWSALGDVGGSVLSGITGTKLVGISVLWFTRSELLKLYYAKMWLALILLGAVHGLILLPVLLSYHGGRGYSSAEDESEVRKRLLRAQDSTEYRPFREDHSDHDSDDAV